MRELRLQEMVPQIYCSESRDFQVFCKAFDLVLNGVKYNSDTIKQLTSTRNIRDNMLPLLSGKLGFITKENFSSDVLRTMLQGFPDIMKYKGSMRAVKESVSLYLRAIGLDCGVKIWYTEEDYVDKNYGMKIPNHSVVIGIDGNLSNIAILKEIFKYILPAGIGYYFYSYASFTYEEEIALNAIAKWVIVSSVAQSAVRKKAWGDFGDYSIVKKSSDWDPSGTPDSDRIIGGNTTLRFFRKGEIPPPTTDN